MHADLCCARTLQREPSGSRVAECPAATKRAARRHSAEAHSAVERERSQAAADSQAAARGDRHLRLPHVPRALRLLADTSATRTRAADNRDMCALTCALYRHEPLELCATSGLVEQPAGGPVGDHAFTSSTHLRVGEGARGNGIRVNVPDVGCNSVLELLRRDVDDEQLISCATERFQ